MDGASGLCLGCLRTLQEISTWSRMDEAAREAILKDLPGRVSQLDPAIRDIVPR